MVIICCLSVPEAAPVASRGPYSFPPPGQLFSVQPKVEPPSSSATAATAQTWEIMESLKLGPQPRANPVATFQMSPAPSSSSTVKPPAAHQDYSTVNLLDLHEFFPNIAQEAVTNQVAPPQTSSSFSLQEAQFRADPVLVDEDLPEFPSFSDTQVPGTLDSLNMEDLEDLLNSRLMGEGGNASALASCQQVSAPKSTAAAQNGAVSQTTPEAAATAGATYMNYPNSIANLLRNEDMMVLSSGSAPNHHPSAVLDDLDELMSADEDRLMSIFNSGSQAGFVSGHPT